MKKNRRLRPYTLVEILWVIFFIGLLSAWGLKYYYHFHYTYRSSIDNAIRMRRIMNIDERWKQALGGTFKQVPQIKNGKIILSKNDYVKADKKEIIIHCRNKKYLLRLPKNTSATLAVEKGTGGSYLAILNLNWKYSHSVKKNATGEAHFVRIISSLRAEQGDKSYE